VIPSIQALQTACYAARAGKSAAHFHLRLDPAGVELNKISSVSAFSKDLNARPGKVLESASLVLWSNQAAIPGENETRAGG
jgi:hypothetical protein